MDNTPRLWGNKRFHALDGELKAHFGKKMAKLCLDAGFTCPTRDGTKGLSGCLFCSSKGSGDFTREGGIKDQMNLQIPILRNKWKNCAFIAYFQSFTNTYAPVEILKKRYDEALSHPDVAGLAVATRCDCLPEEVLKLLEDYNKKTYLWVELGFQTASDVTGVLIRRGFETSQFDRAAESLAKRGIRSVAHLIAGLPGENRDMFLKSVEHVNRLPVWGIKLQMLHVLKDSDLYGRYLDQPFDIMDRDAYVELICDALERLRPDMVIHRLTGDGKKENLHAPLWTLDKRKVLAEIDRELTRRKSYQGCRLSSRRTFKLLNPSAAIVDKSMNFLCQMNDK